MIKLPSEIDMCRFVDSYTRYLLRPIPQKVWHLQKSGGIPGHLATAFCNDAGYICDSRMATGLEKHLLQSALQYYGDDTIAPVMVEGLCTDCIADLMTRSRVKVINKVIPELIPRGNTPGD